MEVEIQSRLREFEQTYNINILFATESGSRAYGFDSTDSDYDIRFIYRRPIDWYLSIQNKRDVIEIEESELKLDFVGWDIKKALFLLNKSNPTFFEWINSPIVYQENSSFIKPLKKLSAICYNPKTCFHHYLGMAQNNFYRYLDTEKQKISEKKYLYVFRCLFACNWILRGNEIPPSIKFDILLKDRGLCSSPFLTDLKTLLEKKRNGLELDSIERNVLFDEFIRKEIDRFKQIDPLKRINVLKIHGPKTEEIDNFLLTTLTSIA